MSALEVFNHKISETKDSFGFQLTLKDFEPIGLIALKIDEFTERVFTLILEALISGNSLIINSSKPINDLVKLSEYLTSLSFNCLNFLNIDDKDVKTNTILTFGGESVGLYLQDLRLISRNSLLKLCKTIALSFGDISFAK